MLLYGMEIMAHHKRDLFNMGIGEGLKHIINNGF
jgi:hypothetical protein